MRNSLTIENISPENIERHLKSMTELYQKVASKASFNLGEFNLKTYKDNLFVQKFPNIFISLLFYINLNK